MVGRRWIAAGTAAVMCLLVAPVSAYDGRPGDGRRDDVPRWTADDLDLLAEAVLVEMNVLRQDPQRYAEKLLRQRRYYRGKLLRLPHGPPILTQEGVDALDEAINVLVRTRPRRQLAWSGGLARAAFDHAEDVGRHNLVGHVGSDRSLPDERVARHGRWREAVAENITFGSMTAREVVIDLLVDDGVADRGHRKVLLDKTLRVSGVACAPHPTYRLSCVMDYAVGFESFEGAEEPQAVELPQYRGPVVEL